jgi:hypothetical protein
MFLKPLLLGAKVAMRVAMAKALNPALSPRERELRKHPYKVR